MVFSYAKACFHTSGHAVMAFGAFGFSDAHAAGTFVSGRAGGGLGA